MATSGKSCKVLPAPIPDHFLPIPDHTPPYNLYPLFLLYFVHKLPQIFCNIFFPISYALQIDVDLRKHRDLDLPGYEFLWNCAICLKPVICGVGLQFQWLEFFDFNAYFDFDNSSWVRCYRCKHSFHTHCVSNLPAKLRDNYFVLTSPFVCCC